MHGDQDYIVPVSYAERAAEVYPDVEYHVMSGAGHGFTGRAFEDSMEHTFAYLQRIGVLGEGAAPEQKTTAAIRMTFGDGTVGMMTDLRDNSTARAFLSQLPMTVTLQDWENREYWYSYDTTRPTALIAFFRRMVSFFKAALATKKTNEHGLSNAMEARLYL